MSKKTHKEFKYIPLNKLPTLGKMQTEWDLKRHYYRSEKDPRIEKDLKKGERAYAAFEKKYKNKKLTSVAKIRAAVTDYVKLVDLPLYKPAYYFTYRTELNSEDAAARRALNKLEERLTKTGNRVLFFELALAKLPKKTQSVLLDDPSFKKYHFYLKDVFDSARFLLSEPEEKILNLKSHTSRGLWITGTEKILNKRTITFKGKEVPINAAIMQYPHLPRRDRHTMWNKTAAVLEEIAEVAENELTALVLDKKVNDELRGYPKPYSATTRGYDSTDKTLETLVRIVETKGYALAHKFYTLKKKISSAELHFIDRNEPVGRAPKVGFKNSVAVVRDVFYSVNKKYGEFFDTMLTEGCIDVFPKKGKGSGAFCSSGVNMPTFLFLNHNDSFDALRVLAHEMGHAVHSYCSKRQPAIYQNYSTLTAETASTFFESLVSDSLMQTASEKERLFYLNASIGDQLSTIAMCVARFKFELEMHERIRKEGGMSWREMAEGLAKHYQAYVGPSVATDYRDGLHFVCKTHYRRNFYQYTYPFGEIGSSIMRRRLRDDKHYNEKVDLFLSLGGSASVENIFKCIDIDMSKEKTFQEGLSLLEENINEFDRLVRKQ